MVLLNIETLSDSEIRYIAQQEDLEDWDTLSREELIDCLQELYSDSETPSDTSRSRNHKYFNTLTSTQSDLSSLPGVTPLTDVYNETYIYVIAHDANWVNAFWEINENKKKQIDQNKESIVIRTTAEAKGKEAEQSFDISVSFEDNNWNIELPWYGRTYTFSLIVKNGEKESVLCKTEKHYVPTYYFLKNSKELAKPDTYNLLVSSMISKDGHLVDCNIVREIIENA